MQCLAPPARCDCLTGLRAGRLLQRRSESVDAFTIEKHFTQAQDQSGAPGRRCPRLPHRRLYGVLTAISALLPCACQLKSQVSQRRVAKEEVAIRKVVEARQRMCTILQRAVQESLGV
jgi:hypothetical protein